MLSAGILGLTVPVVTWHSQNLAQNSLGYTYPVWVKHLNLSCKTEWSKFAYNRTDWSVIVSNGHRPNHRQTATLEKHSAGSAVHILVTNCEERGDASCVDKTRRWFRTLEYEGQHFQSVVCSEVIVYFIMEMEATCLSKVLSRQLQEKFLYLYKSQHIFGCLNMDWHFRHCKLKSWS